MDKKIKTGKVEHKDIFQAIRHAVMTNKIILTVDENLQGGKLVVQLVVRKIKAEVGLKLKGKTDTDPWVNCNEMYIEPLMDIYNLKFNPDEMDIVTSYEVKLSKLKERLSHLEFRKEYLEKQQQNNQKPTEPECV